MLSEKDLAIIKSLRNNARKSLVHIASKIQMPTSTVYDKVGRYEQGIIKKYATIVDFEKLGYFKRMFIIIQTKEDERNAFQEFISQNEKVNSVYKINGDFDFLVEAVFKDEKEMYDFIRHLDGRFQTRKRLHSVIKDIKRESFLN